MDFYALDIQIKLVDQNSSHFRTTYRNSSLLLWHNFYTRKYSINKFFFKCVSSYLSINTSIFLFINSPYIYILIYIIVQRLYFILTKSTSLPKRAYPSYANKFKSILYIVPTNMIIFSSSSTFSLVHFKYKEEFHMGYGYSCCGYGYGGGGCGYGGFALLIVLFILLIIIGASCWGGFIGC